MQCTGFFFFLYSNAKVTIISPFYTNNPSLPFEMLNRNIFKPRRPREREKHVKRLFCRCSTFSSFYVRCNDTHTLQKRPSLSHHFIEDCFLQKVLRPTKSTSVTSWMSRLTLAGRVVWLCWTRLCFVLHLRTRRLTEVCCNSFQTDRCRWNCFSL